MRCSRCGATTADTYLPDGASACRPCYYADEIRRKEESAAKNAVQGGISAIVVGVPIAIVLALVARRLAILGALMITGGVASVRYGVRKRRELAARAALSG